MSRERTIPPPLERTIQNAIMVWLRVNGYRVIRQNSGALPNEQGRPVRFGEPGLPDILALRDGRYIWVEVKRPGRVPTAIQQQVHADLRQAGATVIVATSVDDLAAQLHVIQPAQAA